MKKYLLFILFTSLWIVSCSQHSEHREHASRIHLNDGEKWDVNAEMVPPLNKGRELLHSYVSSGSDDHRTLANGLAVQNSALISSCTMEGESHEVLHEWLHPHLELVKALSNANSTDEAQVLVEQIQRSYSVFDQYFTLDQETRIP